MKNKSSQQRVAEAAIKYALDRSNGVLSIDTCWCISLGRVTSWIEEQDESISPERIVFVAREAYKLIADHYRKAASL